MPEQPETVADATRSVIRVVINGPIQAVWDEITRSDDVIPCFFNMRMSYKSLEAGSTLSMRTKSGRNTGAVGEILVVDPPHHFAHTFRFTDRDDPPCTIRYTLKEVDGGTEFTLAIEDMVPGTKTAKQMTGGAGMIAGTLKACIEDGRPGLGTRVLFRVFALTEPLTPKRCRSEHWTDWG